MAKFFKSLKGNAILTAALSLLYGLVLVIWPDTSAKTLCYVIGAAIIIVGIVYVIQYIRKDVMRDFYRRELVYGLFAIVIGIIALVRVEVVESIIPIVLGIIVLFSGIVKLQNAFDLLRMKYNNWPAVMIMAVINIILAIILLVEPIWVVNFLFRMIGIGLVFSGLSDLVTILFFTGKAGSGNDDQII